MSWTLGGVTLPAPVENQRETSWMKADRRFLDGTLGEDVTANLRRFRLKFMATAAQVAAMRTLFYKTSPLNYCDTGLSVDCWVFPAGTMRVEYLAYRPAGGIVASVEIELWEHGAVYAGAAYTLTEPAAGASAVWSIGGNPVGAPQTYTVEYVKQTIAHPCADGTVWMASIGVQRVWTLSWQAVAEADAALYRTAQATKAAAAFLTPTDEDSASAYVYVETLPETQVLGTSGASLRFALNIRLVEAVSGGGAVPSVKVELDYDGAGDFSAAEADITGYVTSLTLDRKSVSDGVGPSGVGGTMSHEAEIELRHGGGTFSPFNAGSRLTDQFYGKLVRISLGYGGATAAVFTGRVLLPSEKIGERKASLLARDLGAFLLKHKRGDTALYQATPSHSYLAAILTAAGMTEGTGAGQYQLDAGNYVLPFAWMDRETYLAEVDQVVGMEGGRAYFDMAGCFRFEAADHLLFHASSETFTVASLTDLRIDWDVDNIANRVVVESAKRYLAVQQVIWAAQEVYRVPAKIEHDSDGVAAGSTSTVVNLTTAGSYGADSLKGEWLRLSSGTYAYQGRKIKSNAATVAGVTAVTVETAFGGAPAALDGYKLGGVLEVDAKFLYPSASVATPVAWTQALQDANGDFDYQAMTGGGQDATSDLSIRGLNGLAVTAYAASARLLLVNGAAEACYMHRLQLRGNPLLVRDAIRTEEYDQDSIDAYQERDPLILAGEKANVYVQDEVHARSVAQMLLGRFKNPNACVQISGLKGVATRELGQRVTITETQSGLSLSEWFITAIADRFSVNGGWTQDLTLTAAAMLGATSDAGVDWFVLDTSKYGTGAGHGHLYY